MRPIAVLATLAALAYADSSSGQEQWSKTVTCPEGTTYRDIRQGAIREELCERPRDGGVVVRNGPYRSWFGPGYPAETGEYENGRRVGGWQRCTRFGQCDQVQHERTSGFERQREQFSNEIPLQYSDGTFTFDFGSCRSGGISRRDGGCVTELDVRGDGRYRCEVTHTRQCGTQAQGRYLCRVPYSIGLRRMPSLDFLSELPAQGLPQFCRAIASGEAIVVQHEQQPLASTVDVECATLTRVPFAPDTLTVRFNTYAAALIRTLDDADPPPRTMICAIEAEWVRGIESEKQDVFRYRLRRNLGEVRRQRACLAEALPLNTCEP